MAYVAILVCAMVGTQTAAQQTAPAPLPNIQKLGPQVGTRVPDFTLVDQKGQSRTLASLMGPKGLMLVFYRSADWCPYCKTQLAELQTRAADLAKNGIGLAAVSYDSVPVLADFSKRRGITFPLLSDPGSQTIKRYGILNTTVPETNQQSSAFRFRARSCWTRGRSSLRASLSRHTRNEAPSAASWRDWETTSMCRRRR